MSEIEAAEVSNGRITNGTGLESASSVPGFRTLIVIVCAVVTSEGARATAHWPDEEHVVARGTPLSNRTDAALPLPGAKFTPRTINGKPSTAPAVTLEGSVDSIVGPIEITTVAVADLLASAWLVAVIVIALGEGAAFGAV